MKERPTPESDCMRRSNDCDALGFWLMTQHARKLERQRDAADELVDKLIRMRAEALKEIHDQFVEEAKALIDRWDKPFWKDTTPIADLIDALRTAVEDYEKTHLVREDTK